MGENKDKKFPYECKDMDPEDKKAMWNCMEGYKLNFMTVGPKKYIVSEAYVAAAASIYNLPVRSDDTFVVTFPKSGTTLVQDLVWLVQNNLDFEKAKSTLLNERFPFLEMSKIMAPKNFLDQFSKTLQDAFSSALAPLDIEQISELPSPRFIKSHLPLSLLPPTLLDNTKVVYVARDPRDTAVSFFHHNVLMRAMREGSEFKPYWNFFIRNQVMWSPYFSHVLEAWEKRNHSNLLFLFYEDLIQDLPAGIRRVAKFLGKELTEEQVTALNEHLKFDNFKNNKSVNMQEMQNNGVFINKGGFVRKGKKGGWREYFDEEMTAQADKWIEDNLRGTDFQFPYM